MGLCGCTMEKITNFIIIISIVITRTNVGWLLSTGDRGKKSCQCSTLNFSIMSLSFTLSKINKLSISVRFNDAFHHMLLL